MIFLVQFGIKTKTTNCCYSLKNLLKAGVHLNTVFSSLNIDLMLITRSRFKQSKIPMLITWSYVVGSFVNFLAFFGYIWEERIFLKGLVKFRKIGNIEDLMKV